MGIIDIGSNCPNPLCYCNKSLVSKPQFRPTTRPWTHEPPRASLASENAISQHIALNLCRHLTHLAMLTLVMLRWRHHAALSAVRQLQWTLHLSQSAHETPTRLTKPALTMEQTWNFMSYGWACSQLTYRTVGAPLAQYANSYLGGINVEYIHIYIIKCSRIPTIYLLKPRMFKN